MYILLLYSYYSLFTSFRYFLYLAYLLFSLLLIEIELFKSEILIASRFAVLALVPPLFAVFALVVFSLVVILIVALAVIVLGLIVLPLIILRLTTFVRLPAIFPTFTFAFLAFFIILLNSA